MLYLCVYFFLTQLAISQEVLPLKGCVVQQMKAEEEGI